MNIRNWIARLRLLAVMAAVMCLLAGCSMYGVSVDTQLKVNADLSGIRVMDVTVPASMFSGKSPLTLEALNRLIEENCPQELTWSYVKNGNTDQYHVELAFDSLADYMMKAKVLTGRSVQLEMEVSDSVWAKGIRVSEDFTSVDLLAWLRNALVSEGLVTADMADGILRTGSTALVYGDRTYKTDSMIRVDEMVSAPLEKIDVLTDIKGMDRYDRAFVIYVPQTSMEANGEELRTYLEGMVPPDAISEWGLYGNGATLTVRKEDLNLLTLNAFSQTVLASEESGAEVTETAPGANVFAFTDRWKEDIDLTAYGCGNGAAIYAGYYVKADSGVQISGAAELSDGLSAELSGDYDGYQLAAGERTDRLSAEFGFSRVYRTAHTDIRTAVKDGNILEREIWLTLQETPEEAHREQIVNRLRERSAAGGDAGECEISAGAGEDGFAAVISMKGEPLVITELSGRILGGTTEITWKTEGGPFSFRKKFSYAETADYSEFLADAAEDHSITYALVFDGAGGAVAEPDKAALKSLETQGIARSADGRTVTLAISGTSYQIEESGSAVNVPGIILWVVIALLIVIAIAVAVSRGAARKVKEKADIRQLQEKMDEKELRRATEAADQAEAKAREAAMQLSGQKQEFQIPESAAEPAETEDSERNS